MKDFVKEMMWQWANVEKHLLYSGLIFLLIGAFFGALYLGKWIPYDLFPLNKYQLIVDTMWVYFGWMPWLLASGTGVTKIVHYCYGF